MFDANSEVRFSGAFIFASVIIKRAVITVFSAKKIIEVVNSCGNVKWLRSDFSCEVPIGGPFIYYAV